MMHPILDRRQQILSGLAGGEALDVLVVGGGINGAGILVDALTRGMRAALIERDDLAVGTSSRSSKLIHGGLRYLEHFDFGLVREALAERRRLHHLAPHLVSMRRFVVPVVGGRWQLPYIGSGLTLYDLLGGRAGGHFEGFGKKELLARQPHLDASTVVGGFEYTDGVCDDARIVIALSEMARRHGGEVVTHAEVKEMTHARSLWEIEVDDHVLGERTVVRTKVVVDATGAFEVDGADFSPDVAVTPSRGIHLVVAGDTFPGNRGMTIRVPDRVVFVIPWGRRWLIGTTDVPHDAPIDRPAATAEEVDYLLASVNEVLSVELYRRDVLATFAGIRPLAGSGDSPTADVSREHQIDCDPRGLVSVRGGKYTTYRIIGAETVDAICKHLGTHVPSATYRLPFVGAGSPTQLEAAVDELGAGGLDPIQARWLVGRHGIEAPEVLGEGERAGYRGQLHPDMPYLAAEAWWAVHREGALTIDDVLARRTRLAIETADHGEAAIGPVADVLTEVFGWTAEQRAVAVAEYLDQARCEYSVV